MARTRVTRTMPVLTSTFASANCTPEVVADVMPGCQSASAVLSWGGGGWAGGRPGRRPGLPAGARRDRLGADAIARLGPREPLRRRVLHLDAPAGGDEG